MLQRVTSKVTARTLVLQGPQDAVCLALLFNEFWAEVGEHHIEIRTIADGAFIL